MGSMAETSFFFFKYWASRPKSTNGQTLTKKSHMCPRKKNISLLLEGVCCQGFKTSLNTEKKSLISDKFKFNCDRRPLVRPFKSPNPVQEPNDKNKMNMIKIFRMEVR